jgi:drug/metabolite transporter (DMT)-like permease
MTVSTNGSRSSAAAPWWAYGCLALSMALVGSYVALSKPLVAALPVFLLAWLRFGIGALAMPHWLRKPADEAPLPSRIKGLLFLESLFGNFLFSICMLYGMSLTSAVSAGVIMASIPAACALLSWIFLRERISGRLWLAIGLAVLGIALVSLSKMQHPSIEIQREAAQNASKLASEGTSKAVGSPALLGNLLLLAAVLCEAAYAVIGKSLTAHLGAKRITSIVNIWGFALMTPLGIWAAIGFDFQGVSAGMWWLLLFYALAASVWTVWLWMTGLKHVSAARAGVFTVMLPVSAAAVGVLALGERMDGLQMLAMSTALIGVWLATRK